MVSSRTTTVLLSAFSTVCFFAISAVLPTFFIRMQRANTLMFTQLHKCHQDSNDIWRQLTQSKVLARTRRQYTGPRAGPPAMPSGQCCSCQQGPPGPPGPRGKDRPPGKSGLNGINGRNGRDGRYVAVETKTEPPCQKCPSAPPGPPGYPGRKGPRGPAGAAGMNGVPGTPGQPGPPGPQGVRGAPGEIGSQGPQGDPGKVLYGGPPGPPGKMGPVGPRGKPGVPGPDGRPGLPGSAGTRGLQGERGNKGSVGAPGPHGPPGLVGQPGSCSHCQVNVHKPHRPQSPSHVPPSAIRHETPEIGYDREFVGESKPQTPQPPPPPRTKSPKAHKKPSTVPVRSVATPASYQQSQPSHYFDVIDTTEKPSYPAPSYTADSLAESEPVKTAPVPDSYQSQPSTHYTAPPTTTTYNPPTTTTTSTTTTTTTTIPSSSQSYDSVQPTQIEEQPSALVPNYGDEATEPVTPEPDMPQLPTRAYSSDQLFIMSPVRAYSQRIVSIDRPATMVRTKQGYNVQLVPSSYGAYPVGKLWDAGTPTKYNPAHYRQLAPPAPRYKRD